MHSVFLVVVQCCREILWNYSLQTTHEANMPNLKERSIGAAVLTTGKVIKNVIDRVALRVHPK